MQFISSSILQHCNGCIHGEIIGVHDSPSSHRAKVQLEKKVKSEAFMQCKNNQTVMFVAGEGRQARNSSRIFHIEIQYSIYFVSKKDVDLKTSTCNNRIVPSKSWQLAEYLIIEYLATFDSHTMLADTG